MSQDVVRSVEVETRGQRNNILWSTIRRGRLTASKFGAVLKACRKQVYPDSLFKSVLGSYNLQGVKSVQWGIDNEATALTEYQKQFDCTVSEAGLVLNSTWSISRRIC